MNQPLSNLQEGRHARSAVLWIPAAMVLAGLVIGAPGAAAADEPRPAPGGAAARTFRVVGYLPDYRAAEIDLESAKRLTDLVYFSAEPGPTGELKLGRIKPEHVRQLQKLKEAQHVALFLCVGGWGRSGGFAKLAAAPEARQRFAKELAEFCRDNRFDGVDVDWEHPQNDAESRDYGELLSAIRREFQPHSFQLTIAMAGWQKLTAEAIAAVDRVNLMAYDGRGRHSTFEFATRDVEQLIEVGVPAGKICLGLPFYGRGIDDRSKALAYAQIVKDLQPGREVDELQGLYFNSVGTIERKTRFALSNKLAGVMIWEIGQDTHDETSLLRAIDRVARAADKE